MSRNLHRPALLDEHPLRRRTYRVPTPSIAMFRALVDECLFLYISGALIHGRPRMGKSYAIEFVRRDLEQRYPQISIYKIRCTRSQVPSENSFFAGLLHAAKHPAQSGASKAALRGRLVHKLRQVADKRGDDRVVLFADEAQNLREIEYEWLRDLHDDLENNELRLFTFLVGQSQLLAQKSALQAQDKEQIVARFMVEELSFRGIGLELHAVLRAAGARRRAAAGRIRSTAVGGVRGRHIKAGIEGAVEIPMKYFTAAIEAALLLSHDCDAETLAFNAAFWSQMVERSRYVMARRAARPMLTAITSL